MSDSWFAPLMIDRWWRYAVFIIIDVCVCACDFQQSASAVITHYLQLHLFPLLPLTIKRDWDSNETEKKWCWDYIDFPLLLNYLDNGDKQSSIYIQTLCIRTVCINGWMTYHPYPDKLSLSVCFLVNIVSERLWSFYSCLIVLICFN